MPELPLFFACVVIHFSASDTIPVCLYELYIYIYIYMSKRPVSAALAQTVYYIKLPRKLAFRTYSVHYSDYLAQSSAAYILQCVSALNVKDRKMSLHARVFRRLVLQAAYETSFTHEVHHFLKGGGWGSGGVQVAVAVPALSQR
jgi:hypothetical protein